MKLGPHFRIPDALNCNLIVGHYLICKYFQPVGAHVLLFCPTFLEYYE